MLLPPTEVQDRIVRFLDEETAKIDNLIKKQESLKDLYSERVVTARNQLLDDVQGEDIRLRWVFSPSAERAHGDEQVLSVYRDYGVIPKESRSDNHNVTPVDISNYRVVAPGDLVINKMKAWQGSLGISRYEGVVSGDYEVLHQTDTRFDSSFLHHFLRSRRMISQYAIRSKGIRPSQWRLYWDEFSEITIPLIPMEQQTGLVGLISEIELQDGLIEKCDRMVELLQERRSALITAAVTGQIEV